MKAEMMAKDTRMRLPDASAWGLFLFAAALLAGGCDEFVSRSGGDDLGVTVSRPGESIRSGVESPRPEAILLPEFIVSGWAIDDRGEGRGPGLDGIQIHWSECSEPTMLAEAEYGESREDIVDGLGLDESYVASGFSARVGPLEPGNYKLAVCARYSGDNVIEVAAFPVTVSLNKIDMGVRDNEFVSLPFTLRGWAVVLGTDSPPGVGFVRVMLGPCDRGQLLAETVPEEPRKDVIDALGLGEEYLYSGFEVELSGDVPAGRQTITACGERSDTGETFSTSRSIDLAQPGQRIGIFGPSFGDEVESPLRIAGWAVDYSGGQGQGTGIASVEIRRGSCETGNLLAEAELGEPTPGTRDDLKLDASYTNLGFVATLPNLELGEHTFRVCAFSEITNTYFGRTLRVTVVAAKP